MNDKQQIGLSHVGNEKIKDLIYNPDDPDNYKPFHQQIHVFKFAVALALRCGKMVDKSVKYTTKWNVAGSLDKDGSLGKVVEHLYPEDCAHEGTNRIMERLGEWGIHELVRRLEEQENDEPSFTQILDSLD